jgi:hypothetical protein
LPLLLPQILTLLLLVLPQVLTLLAPFLPWWLGRRGGWPLLRLCCRLPRRLCERSRLRWLLTRLSGRRLLLLLALRWLTWLLAGGRLLILLRDHEGRGIVPCEGGLQRQHGRKGGSGEEQFLDSDHGEI